jgi:RimJ/RimL family protein N-acetyltransferase
MMERFTLEGARVRLEPLTMAHADELLAAAEEDRSTYGWTRTPHGAAGVVAYIDAAHDEDRIPFATYWKEQGRVVGSTSFFPEWWGDGSGPPDVVEIGATFLAASAQRTPVNTEAKLLMLTHAFEVWRVRSVCLHTDVRNQRSRDAIQRIGGKFEGILRAHRLAVDLNPRDSGRFSITAPEWPAVRQHLEQLTARHDRS